MIDLDLSQADSFLQIFSKNFYMHSPNVEEEIGRTDIKNLLENVSLDNRYITHWIKELELATFNLI